MLSQKKKGEAKGGKEWTGGREEKNIIMFLKWF